MVTESSAMKKRSFCLRQGSIGLPPKTGPHLNSILLIDLPIVNSVFSSGDFYKLEVKETAIYKLDKTYLRNAGINIDNINPKTIKIFGNDGTEIPYDNSIEAKYDPVENKIHIAGEEDGVFNDNDYILFYGKAPHDWTYDSLARTWVKNINHFSNKTILTIIGLLMEDQTDKECRPLIPLLLQALTRSPLSRRSFSKNRK